jgi:hypothetical protein
MGQFFFDFKEGRSKSPFDAPGVKTKVTIRDILSAVRESRKA